MSLVVVLNQSGLIGSQPLLLNVSMDGFLIGFFIPHWSEMTFDFC